MYQIGLSTCRGKLLNRETFECFSNAGITSLELSLRDDQYRNIDYNNIEKLSKEYGVNLWSFHLPFTPFDEIDISSMDDNMRIYTVNYLKSLVNQASAHGFHKFIIHPSGEPINEKREERLNYSKESLYELAEYASSKGAVIAVENLPRTCLGKNSAEIQELISAHNKLCVCFDTNHLLEESSIDFIHRLGQKIITLHISDYDFIDERHWLPGEGKIPWNELYNALNEISYNGVWMYELGFSEPEIITRSRDLTCEDFVRNANEIFDGKKITVLTV